MRSGHTSTFKCTSVVVNVLFESGSVWQSGKDFKYKNCGRVIKVAAHQTDVDNDFSPIAQSGPVRW